MLDFILTASYIKQSKNSRAYNKYPVATQRVRLQQKQKNRYANARECRSQATLSSSCEAETGILII
jgi:hypothetical protein